MSKEKWEKLLSTKRYGQNHVKDKEQYRSDFHKDYDRIVFSSAFRRLGRKHKYTQWQITTIFIHV